MKRIIYYITDHGRGHASRSVAVIRELEKLGIEVFVRNSNVIDFLQKSLPKIRIIEGITDVGPSISSNGVSIDENKTKSNIINWIDKLDYFASREINTISRFEPDLIVSDISAMPLLAAKKTNKNSIAISNFSWYDVLKFLPKEKSEILRDVYNLADLAIQLPLGTSMEHFQTKIKSGLISREPIASRYELRKKFGIRESDIAILFALGNSNVQVSCQVGENIKILSMNTIIKNSNYLQFSDWVEGQEVVAASDLVICKCGYGLISECLTNGTPFCYISDDNHLEQYAIFQELSKMGLRNRITFDDVIDFRLSEKYKNIMSNIIRKSIDTINVVKNISEFLKN